MEITKVRVYGESESVIASGLPMSVDGEPDYNMKRAENLAQSLSGSGHDCFLKGIVVQANVQAPQYWWLQFGRYHFSDIISSQSKMHRITKIDLTKQCNSYVDDEVIEHLKWLIKLYNDYQQDDDVIKKIKDNTFQRIIANTPMGLELKARITTNYLQLKTIYRQRRSHKLKEWSIFCDFIKELPHKEWITNE